MGAKPMKDSEVDKFIAFANLEDSSGFAYDSLIGERHHKDPIRSTDEKLKNELLLILYDYYFVL